MKKLSKAYILHTGAITAIGNKVNECYTALSKGEDGIALPQFLDTFWKATFPVAEVKKSNAELSEMLSIPASWPRTALLSAKAVQECLQAYPSLQKNYAIGFFSANTVGGMDLTEGIYGALKQDAGAGTLEQFARHECGAITALVAKHFGIKGFTTTISTACSSSANSIMMAAQMIETGMLDVAIAGGADSLSKFTLNGFNTLMIVDKQKCQPFDQKRRGLNLGEGAGYLLLVSEKVLKELGVVAEAYVSGYANANDAYHQTASSPEGRGNQLAMRNAMQVAGLEPSEVDYINAHGTGTPNNDSAESIAIEAVFGNDVPPFSSTKCFTGHTLGASGGVEAVFSVLSLRHGAIFPNLRLETGMEDVAIRPATTFASGRNIKHVMSNSFGFGGNCSSLILSQC